MSTSKKKPTAAKARESAAATAKKAKESKAPAAAKTPEAPVPAPVPEAPKVEEAPAPKEKGRPGRRPDWTVDGLIADMKRVTEVLDATPRDATGRPVKPIYKILKELEVTANLWQKALGFSKSENAEEAEKFAFVAASAKDFLGRKGRRVDENKRQEKNLAKNLKDLENEIARADKRKAALEKDFAEKLEELAKRRAEVAEKVAEMKAKLIAKANPSEVKNESLRVEVQGFMGNTPVAPKPQESELATV